MSSNFPPSLWDDSDPAYAPFLKRIRASFYWVPSKRYVEAGWNIKTYRLEGSPGDGLDLERAAACRALTRDLVDWWKKHTGEKAEEGTWGWLVKRYIGDEFSAIHDVRPSTREKYIKELGKIERGIGKLKIVDTDFEELSRLRRAMEKNGRSTHYIKSWFTHFGLIVSHGIKLRVPGCADVKEIRSEMRIQNAPRRTIYATVGDIEAVVRRADAHEQEWLSLALLFRFEFMLRGVDVYGEWSPVEDREGGIQHNGRMWERGLTWEMFDRGLTSFEKVISKTERSLPEAYNFDLTGTPEIRRRLLAVPAERRAGPVIVLPDGTPPKMGVISRAFKAHVTELKLDPRLQIRDARAGGITEAKTIVDPYSLRDAAQHTQITTTDIYTRGRSDTANKVVSLRQEARKKNAS